MNRNGKLGPAGTLARAWIESKLTPLVIAGSRAFLPGTGGRNAQQLAITTTARKDDDMTRNCVATVQVANNCKPCTAFRPVFQSDLAKLLEWTNPTTILKCGSNRSATRP